MKINEKYDFYSLSIGAGVGMFFIELLKNLFVTTITMVITVWIGFHLQRWLQKKYKDKD
jgi:hypothetical protein